MNYRREIDGLRALAVLPVIFFHAGINAFSGGFVGVDVFFVISGYLITLIILNEISEGRFSIVKFYERRARRILPALFFVMAVSLPVAWFTLLPLYFKEYASSIVAVSLFSSNFLFWRESGYFETESELKPLLHTWSLAVEEQFYLLLPVVLICSWFLGKKALTWFLLVIGAITSFALAQWGHKVSPAAAFFLLPTRAWELAIGSLIALYFFKDRKAVFPSVVGAVLSGIGILLITYAIVFFDERTPFPGVHTLFPVVGTALVIIFAQPDNIVGKVLGARSLVGIGLISYSAYLWHQPLFVFVRHRFESPADWIFLLLSFVSLALAYFSWRYVESPFRNSQRISRRAIFLGTLVVSVLFVMVGLWYMHVGNYSRYSAEQNELIKFAEEQRKIVKTTAYGRGHCFIDQNQSASVLEENNCIRDADMPRIVFFGDSEAAHYYAVEDLAENHGYSVQYWTGASCRPIDFRRNTARCRDFKDRFNQEVLPRLSEHDLLVVSANWWDTYERIGESSFRASLREAFSKIASTPVRVLVLGGTPDFERQPIESLIYAGFSLGSVEDRMLSVQDYRPSNAALKETSISYGFSYFDPAELLCDAEDRRKCLFVKNGDFLYFDSGHLSSKGARYVLSAALASGNFSASGAINQ